MTVARQEHYGELIDRCTSHDIIKCEKCGFIHISPLPSDEELHRIYTEEYYTIEKPLFITQQHEDINWWRTIFDDRYDYLEKQLGNVARTILDIGCGPGFFLQRGEERGWQGVGVEPSRQAFVHARSLGCEVHNLFLHQAVAKLSGRRFNAIHMSEVLEHVPNPKNVCETAYGMLEPGGIMCVVVPNDYNPLQSILHEQHEYHSYWLAPPHHINYFTFDSMTQLLRSVGFSILGRTSTFPMELFLLMGDNYVGNDTLGRSCHAKRKCLDIALSNNANTKRFRVELYELMSKYFIGREMVVYATK